MKIKIENARIWRSGSSYVITIPEARAKGIIEGTIVDAILKTKEAVSNASDVA